MEKFRIMLLLFAVFMMANTFGQLTLGLKAFYGFGGDAHDGSGHNNNGVLIGNPVLTTDRFNYTDCAYQFPGSSTDYIEIPYSSDFDILPSAALSISLWYQGGTSATGDFEELFLKQVSLTSSLPSAYHLALYDLNKPSFGSEFSPYVMPPTAPSAPDWHHLVGIYDNKNWDLYVDDTWWHGSDYSGLNSILQSSGSIHIGKYFNGKIDDIRFYDRVLTASEVHDIFVLPGSCSELGMGKFSEQPVFNVFPNPTTGTVYLETSNTTKQTLVSVFDIRGQEIIMQSLNQQNSMIDLSSFPIGLYLIRLTSGSIIRNSIIQKQN